MQKSTKIAIATLAVVILIFCLAVGFWLTAGRSGSSSFGERLSEASETTEDSFQQGENGFGYKCSKPIRGKWVSYYGNPKDYEGVGPETTFVPSNEEDFKKFCRTDGSVSEYHAVIDVLKMKDVDETISSYDTSQAWVDALSASYIKDKAYIDRILPAYKDTAIHCIIVVHSPKGTRFFLENGNKENDYIEVPTKDFLESLNKAPDDDVNNFWLGLH